MARWQIAHPIIHDVPPQQGGDTVYTGFSKLINEFGAIYNRLNDLRSHRAGNTPPSGPIPNELWLDTSVNPPTLKRWDGTNWATVGASSVGGTPTTTGWTRVADVTVPAGSTAIDVTGLNGDADGGYMIVFTGVVQERSDSVDRHLLIRPNALSITTPAIMHQAWFYPGYNPWQQPVHVSPAGFLLSGSAYATTTHALTVGYLRAATGTARIWQGQGYIRTTSNVHAIVKLGSYWTDTTTNITSLRFVMDANTFSGRIIIFKPA